MAKLVLSMNSAVQGEYELDQERFTIGRKPENEIQIDNLAVSGKHALIITILDDSFLEDLGSTNGTYVNGKLVKKHALKDGDVIAIGKHELKYINENASDDEDEFEKTMIIKPGSASAAVAGLFYDDKITIGHVGDSRVYRFRDGKFQQMTKDHSLIQEVIDKGLYTPEEAAANTPKKPGNARIGY